MSFLTYYFVEIFMHRSVYIKSPVQSSCEAGTQVNPTSVIAKIYSTSVQQSVYLLFSRSH